MHRARARGVLTLAAVAGPALVGLTSCDKLLGIEPDGALHFRATAMDAGAAGDAAEIDSALSTDAADALSRDAISVDAIFADSSSAIPMLGASTVFLHSTGWVVPGRPAMLTATEGGGYFVGIAALAEPGATFAPPSAGGWTLLATTEVCPAVPAAGAQAPSLQVWAMANVASGTAVTLANGEDGTVLLFLAEYGTPVFMNASAGGYPSAALCDAGTGTSPSLAAIQPTTAWFAVEAFCSVGALAGPSGATWEDVLSDDAGLSCVFADQLLAAGSASVIASASVSTDFSSLWAGAVVAF